MTEFTPKTRPMTKRWVAVVTYRADSGRVDVTHDFDELEDLHELIEAGPSFYAIKDIRITYQHSLGHETVETEANS